jgi:3-oxoacyl-[acyl-carrier protein] reductase
VPWSPSAQPISTGCLGIDVAGQLFATQVAAAAMTAGGRILLTSSISARIGVYQHTLYAAGKAAVSAMELNLAPELTERGNAINAIAPGPPPPTWPPKSTPSTPHRRCETSLSMRSSVR